MASAQKFTLETCQEDSSSSILNLKPDPGFSNTNLVFRPGKTGFCFFPTRAIDSEHDQRGVCKFIAPRMQFEKTTLFFSGKCSKSLGFWTSAREATQAYNFYSLNRFIISIAI